MTERKNKNSSIGFLCIATIVCTVLTQLPAISGIFRPIMYALWILALVAGIVINKFRIPCNRFIIMYGIVLLVLGLECLVLSSTHTNSYALQVVPLPFICYLVGLLFEKSIRENTIYNSLFAFFLVSFLMFSYIFVTYIGSFNTWLNANYYIYEQKNSAAQIIGCTIILSFFLLQPKQKWVNVAKCACIIILFLFIIAMQCRTALVSLIVTAIVYYLTILHGKKKIAVTVILCIALAIVFNNDILIKYITKAFVFTERQTKNLDYFTSGRLTYYKYAIQAIKENPIVGTGHYRVDDLYLCILSDVGLIGFAPIISLWIVRIAKNISAYHKNKTPFTSCVLCLTVFYFGESLFEAYPPFGPGVCAFMFWIVCAFLDARGNHQWKKTEA